jgi:hypothetical protein
MEDGFIMTTEEKLTIMRRWCFKFEKWGCEEPGSSGYIRMQYSGRKVHWERTHYYDEGEEEKMIDHAYRMIISYLIFVVEGIEYES